MANDGNGDNDITPLLQYLGSNSDALPESDDVAIPMPMTPSFLGGSQKPSTSSSSSNSSSLPPLLPLRNPKSTRPCKHLSKTAPPMVVTNDVSHPSDKQESLDSKSFVRQAIALFIIYLSLGVVFYWWNIDHYVKNTTHPLVDALYTCIVTLRTIGFGDIIPNTVATKLFSVLFVLVGFGFINILLTAMLTYFLHLQESYILEDATKTLDSPIKSYIIDLRTGRMRIRFKVGLALGVVVLCVGFGVLIMHYIEEIEWLDSFYCSVMSVTTVGCGDRAFKTMAGRLIASIWFLVSTLAVARVFLYLAEATLEKRNQQRANAKTVLDENMSVSQFFAADIDHNGCVSKADFVIYKLMKMEKITEKDTKPIAKQFDKLDRNNRGKITLQDLSDTNTD